MDDSQTNDNWIPNKDPLVTVENVVKFFDDKRVRSECPCCNGTDWGVCISSTFTMMGAEITSVPSIPLLKDGLLDGGFFPVVIASCNNCGYVRQHMRKPIEDWLKAKGEANEL